MMITFPDGNKKEYAKPVTGQQIAQNISPSLAKAALAIKVNETLKDLSFSIEEDTAITLITAKDPEGLDLMRHTCAHILAQAVKELFPETQITIGPVIENGFYYDFARKDSFSEEDLEKIEKKMKEIVEKDLPLVREVWDRNKAIKFFKIKRNITRPRLFLTCQKINLFLYIPKALSQTCVADRIFLQPENWEKRLN